MKRLKAQAPAISCACAILIASLWAACVTVPKAPEPDPMAALEGYESALQKGETAEAYAYLAPSLRQDLSFESFKRFFERHKEAMVSEARRLVRLAEQDLGTQEAWVKIGNHRAHLVRTGNGWRLTAPIGTVIEGREAPIEKVIEGRKAPQ
jgi:hypothetical protein